MTQIMAHSLLVRTPPYPTRRALNTVIWAIGIALECILAFTIFFRRIARRFPFFTALMVFYPVRAAALFVAQGRMDGGLYDSIYGVLSFLEFLLQVFLAVEVGHRLIREAGGWTGWRRLVPVSIPLAAGVLAWIVGGAVAGKAPADRVEIFIWFLMIGLFAAAAKGSRAANPILITAGFAAFSLLQLAALAGRVHAYLGRDTGQYLAWSYIPAIGYLAVVVFWLIALRREPSPIEAEKSAVSQ